MRFLEKVGKWNIYKLYGKECYVAFCSGYFPLEAESFEKLKVRILDGMKARGEL